MNINRLAPTAITIFLVAATLCLFFPTQAAWLMSGISLFIIAVLGLLAFSLIALPLGLAVELWRRYSLARQEWLKAELIKMDVATKQWRTVNPNEALFNLTTNGTQLPHAYHLRHNEQLMLMKQTPLNVLDNRQLSSSSQHSLPNPHLQTIPGIRHDYWFGEIIAGLKHEMDMFNQPLTTRISGNPGTGKTLLAMNLLAELIKPFQRADIEVLDRKAASAPKKWGSLNVLADTIESYPSAIATLDEEMKQRSASSEPLFVIADENDEANRVYGDLWQNWLSNMVSVGRELRANPFVIGQSPLVKDSGINSAIKNFFTLWVVLGLEGIEQFLNSADCRWSKNDKQAYKSQLTEIASERFIGLTMPSRHVSKPFLFVTPHLQMPHLGQTAKRTILDLPVCLSAADNGGLGGYANQTDRQTKLKSAVLALQAAGVPLKTSNMRVALRAKGHSFDNGALSQLLTTLRNETT